MILVWRFQTANKCADFIITSSKRKNFY